MSALTLQLFAIMSLQTAILKSSHFSGFRCGT
jgi:hypothetical protein